jgi:hypothetical protein
MVKIEIFFIKLLIKQRLSELQINRELSSISLGLRYASLKGAFRPFIGGALTYTWQKANGASVYDGFPMLFEFGGIVPIKQVSLVFQGNFSPLVPSQHGFQVLSYSIGLMF